jgi:hypothetical protein
VLKVVFDTNVYISAFAFRGSKAEKAFIHALEGDIELYTKEFTGGGDGPPPVEALRSLVAAEPFHALLAGRGNGHHYIHGISAEGADL